MARYAYAIILNSETLKLISADWHDYDGPVDQCKGGPSKEQQKIENDRQASMDKMALSQLAMTNPTIQQIIANGGMLPAQENAETSIALNSLPKQYNDLFGALNQRLRQSGVTGGQFAGGGDLARSFGSLGAKEADQESNLLTGIQERKGQQLFGALGLGQQPLGPLLGAGSSAGANATSAANQASASQTGFWGSLFGALASPFQITKSI